MFGEGERNWNLVVATFCLWKIQLAIILLIKQRLQ